MVATARPWRRRRRCPTANSWRPTLCMPPCGRLGGGCPRGAPPPSARGGAASSSGGRPCPTARLCLTCLSTRREALPTGAACCRRLQPLLLVAVKAQAPSFRLWKRHACWLCCAPCWPPATQSCWPAPWARVKPPCSSRRMPPGRPGRTRPTSFTCLWPPPRARALRGGRWKRPWRGRAAQGMRPPAAARFSISWTTPTRPPPTSVALCPRGNCCASWWMEAGGGMRPRAHARMWWACPSRPRSTRRRGPPPWPPACSATSVC